MSANKIHCCRLIGAVVLSALAFVTSPLRADEIGLDSPYLGRYEQQMASRVKNCRIIARENILLVWPQGMQPCFVPSSCVTNFEEMADWLESAYKLMREWTFYDPNAFVEKQNGERTRLVFLWDGSKNYHSTRGHAYIGASSPHADENWFGHICHELSHDFFHAHPDFRGRLTVWNEGACGYMRYHLLSAMGMSQAAAQWEKTLYRADPNSRYHGKARQILDLERKNKWSGPAELWQKLKGRDINFVISGITPYQEFLGREANEALVAVWDFEAQNDDDAEALADKAPSGDGTRGLSFGIERGAPALPVRVWRETAMIVSLQANATMLEFDEVRIYNRALSEEDCIAISPGGFSL